MDEEHSEREAFTEPPPQGKAQTVVGRHTVDRPDWGRGRSPIL